MKKNLYTVLLIEDEEMTRYMIRECLERHDFLVIEAAYGQRSVDIIMQHNADIILLDFNLPDGTAIDYIDEIRDQCDAPIVIVSSERSEEIRTSAYEAGADDYIVKPVRPDFLIKRIKAHIKRYERLNIGHGDEIREKTLLKFPDIVLDKQKYRASTLEDSVIDLTTQEFELLFFMALRPDDVFSKDELCDVLEKDGYKPATRALDVKITRIRKKLKEAKVSPDLIRTVRGVGFSFVPINKA